MTIFNREDARTVLPQLEKQLNNSITDVNNVLDNIGKVYYDSSSKTISTAGIDNTPVQGATIKLPKGHAYVIIGQWTFNTGSSSTTRNNQIVIKDITNNANRSTQRIMYADQSFAVMQAMYITGVLKADTQFAVCASSSMTYTTASNNFIEAICIK